MSTKTLEAGLGEAETFDDNRHERKCLVCNHPERDAIDDAYLHWYHPHSIAVDYDLPERSINNHAIVTGLRARRAQDRRSILELILQRAEYAKVTGDTIIHALRAYSCITDDGRWTEPESRVVFSYQPAVPGAPAHAQSAITAETIQSGLQNYAIRTIDVQPAEGPACPDEGPERSRRAEDLPRQLGPTDPGSKEILIGRSTD